MLRTVTAAILAAIVLAVPAQAQKLKDGSEGTGGGAGYSPPLEGQSTEGAPSHRHFKHDWDDSERKMMKRPAEEEKKDESTPPADATEKPKQ